MYLHSKIGCVNGLKTQNKTQKCLWEGIFVNVG